MDRETKRLLKRADEAKNRIGRMLRNLELERKRKAAWIPGRRRSDGVWRKGHWRRRRGPAALVLALFLTGCTPAALNLAPAAAHASCLAADLAVTERVIARGGSETSPAGQSRASRIGVSLGIFAVASAFDWYGMDWPQLILAGTHCGAAAFNTTQG